MQGRTSLRGQTRTTVERGTARLQDGELTWMTEETHAGEARTSGHQVHFYDDARELSREVSRFLADGLAAADSALIIATAAHCKSFCAELAQRGLDVPALTAAGRLTLFDAEAALAAFLRDGQPDRALFETVIGKTVADAAVGLKAPARLLAYGEMVDLLWSGGQRAAAIQLEELWSELQGRHSFELLCAYARGSFLEGPAQLQRVCAAHSSVLGSQAAPEADRQVCASGSPSEHIRLLEREIAERKEVEQSLREALRSLRTKEEHLRRSEEQLRDFVDNATIGLHRVGPDGTILWANRYELELLGYEEHEYVGRSITDYHADADVIADVLARLSRGEALQNYEARLRARDGSIKHVLISSSASTREGRFLHTRCFTRDITERRRAQQALEQSHQQLQLITDALPVLVGLIDAEQRYQFASAGYERWFGHARSEVIGRRMDDVLGAAAYQAIRLHVSRALAGETVTYEAEVPYRAGGPRWIHASYLPQRDPAGGVTGFVALVSDITEKKEFERFRSQAAARAEKLLAITRAIAAAVSPEEVFEALVERVADAVGASSGALWLTDHERDVARLMRARGYTEAARQRLEVLPLGQSPRVPALDCICSGEPVWIASQAELFERYPHLVSMASAGRSYRIACLPLVANQDTLGALALTIEQGEEEGTEEREFLLLVSRYASQAIVRLRLLEAERSSRDAADAAAARLTVLGRSSRAFAESSLDLSSRLREIVVELARTLDSCVCVSLIDATGLLRLAAVQHPDPEAQSMLMQLAASAPLRMGEGITGPTAATGQSVLLGSVSPEQLQARAARAYQAFCARHPAHALMSAPLRVQGRVIGTVTSLRCREGQTYTEEDLRLLEELGERAAAAVENSRLYQETLDAKKRAEQLYRFAQAVVSAERVEHVFDAALAAIEASLGAERAAVLICDGDGVMRFRAWRSLSERYRSAVEGHSPWPADASSPEPLIIADAEHAASMAGYLPLFRAERIGALAFFPLVTAGRLLGKFMIYYQEPHAFSAGEVETARAIANHLASVVTRFAAIGKLEETVRYNELFAGILAHDLRNPLSAMTTAAQLLLMQREGEATRAEREAKPLSRILASGDRMRTMIEQLLDFTRARSGGGIVVEPRPVNLAELCAQAIGEIELAHPARRIEQLLDGDPNGTWDGDRLLQVLSNLIANACQHGTPETPVAVRIDGSEPRQVTVEVHNLGAIPAPLLEELFDPFRSTRHQRQRSRGLGLGLFIVREIVRAHGGTVTVSSTESQGTTFAIALPRA